MVSRVAVTAKFHTPRRTIPHSHPAKVATHPGQESPKPNRLLGKTRVGVPEPGRRSPAPPPPPSINAPAPGLGAGARPGTRPDHNRGASGKAPPKQPPARPSYGLATHKTQVARAKAPRALVPGARLSGARARPVRGAAPGRASGPSRSPLGVRRLPPPLPPPPPCECSGV